MNILQSGICTIILTASTETASMGKYSKALLNTVLGMGTVFTVLIFIAILIYLIKFIPMIVDKFTNQNKQNETNSLPEYQATAKNTVFKEEVLVELVNDSELVAVITAAIMASMGVDAPADGLFVKSIRRANTKKWQNA